MARIKGWYNGPKEVPLLVYVYLDHYSNVFEDGYDVLDKVRDHYDNIGLTYGFEYKITKGFIVKLDYFPLNVDDQWELALSLYFNTYELGRIREMTVTDEDITFVCKSFRLTFPIANIMNRVNSIRKTVKEDELLAQQEAEENAINEEIKKRFG